MLPRIAKLDRQFAEAVQRYVQLRARDGGLLQEIQAHVIHEGRDSAIRRSPSEIEQTEMFEASAEAKLPFEDIDAIDAPYILRKADEIAEQFKRQFSERLLVTVQEATVKHGLKKDAGGKPLTNEMMIEILSVMHVNFERSQAGDIVIVASPGMVPTFQKLEREANENPMIRAKWDAMMENKRNEFREREINRNLVG